MDAADAADAAGAATGSGTAAAPGTAVTLGFNPWSPEFVAYPYNVYAALRERSPVAYFPPTDQWVVARYDDVNALLRDRRLGRTYLHLATHEKMGRPADVPGSEEFWHVVRNGMLDREPPDHTRLRRLVAKAFTPRTVDRLRPRVQEITDRLVDHLLDAGSGGGAVDLMRTVAEPLPVAVIAEMLGVPPEDRHLLRPWSADICRMYELNPSPDAAATASRAAREFSDYLRDLSRERRVRPRDDLVSALAHVVDQGDRLTEDELIGTCVLLLNAGHEATVNVTGNGWLALFRNPDQLRLLRDDSALLPSGIEELMRYDTPLQMFERWVLDDITVGGVDIARGCEVALLFGSANHDPARFAAPDRLDVTRADNPHISFGAGIHFCLGAPLARVELVTSFGTLLRRAPRLALAEEPRWKPAYIIRGLQELLVTS
jgi:cytochrome P450